MSDHTIAIIIVGTFFAVVCGIFVEGFIREWIMEKNMRQSYAVKIDNLIKEGWKI